MPDTSPPNILAIVEESYRRHFTQKPARASVAFLGVDTIEILRFSDALGQTYVSLGMSQYAMTDPSSDLADIAGAPRAELLLGAVNAPDAVYRQLALLAAVPAVEGTVYSAGDRVQIGEPLCEGSRCVGGLLVDSGLPPIEVTGVAAIDVLQLLPATPEELAWSRIHGNDALRERWRENETSLRDLSRASVRLS